MLSLLPMSLARHARLRRMRRTLTALLLGAFVLAWGLDAHHRAWTLHVVCEADGAIAHADHAHDDHGHDHLVGETEEEHEDEGPRLATLPEHGDEHEHCGLPELGRASTLDLPEPPRVGAPPATELVLHIEAGARPHESVPRVALAPKQSPPDAA